MSAQVTDVKERHRWEISDENGQLMGFITYIEREADGKPVRILNHTVVDPNTQGQGIGSQLVRFALDQMREDGQGVVPVCPFVDGWMAKHPEYNDMRVPRG